jgi:hypothetical protein
MAATIYWDADDTTVTSYALSRSSDKGVTYSAVATVAASTVGANYDARSRRYFYTDASAAAGDIFKLVATGSLGTSEPEFAIVPPAAAPVCRIVGYALTGFGEADVLLPVLVTLFGSRGESWNRNPTGTMAQHAEALHLVPASRTVYPDLTGLWAVDVVRGALARVQIAQTGFSWVFRVPDVAGPVNIRDIPQARGQELAPYGELLGDFHVLDRA